MTLEMGRVETQAQESPRAAAQEAVATAVSFAGAGCDDGVGGVCDRVWSVGAGQWCNE